MGDETRFLTLRLADYDPAQAARIERECTLTEIMEALVVRRHDNEAEVANETAINARRNAR